ncbi:MAG: LysR family transcriptional regulator [Clostridiales bacterium]|nr:LysR family transcriptional regulator [Clostridiales bacterium]
MELTQLYFFKKVAQLGNVTKAAEELHITQSALSKSISRLEEGIGFMLFEHKKGRITLSEAGNAFLRHVERALVEIDDGIHEGLELSSSLTGQITFTSSVQHIMPEIIDPFILKHRNSFIKECAYSSKLIKEQILNNEIDFAITSVPVSDPKIEWIPVIEEDMLLLVNPAHPLVDKKEVEISDLKKERFICNETGYDKILLTNIFKEAGFTPNIVFESSEGRVRDDMIRSGFGVGMIPALVAYEIGSRRNLGENRAIRINSPSCKSYTGVLKRKGRILSTVSQEFLDFVLQQLVAKNEEIALATKAARA